jgi:hypothetical protein
MCLNDQTANDRISCDDALMKAAHDVATSDQSVFMRRQQAGTYCSKTYGFGAPRTLAKLAVAGGGPEFHKAGRIVLYTKAAIDNWALAKIGTARHSTSEPECA